MEAYVIIVAGGVGTRMKSDRPKQFIDLNGVPVIVHTINAFLRYKSDIQIIVSVHKNYKSHFEGIIAKYHLPSSIIIVIGGETRFDSVKNGLKAIGAQEGIVAIHDAARPLVSTLTIRKCFETAYSKGNAIPCVLVNESMRKISNNINQAVNRNEYRIIQTPQCFRLSEILPAFETGYQSAFTDDATVLEAAGGKINLVEGNTENIKITSPHDLILAQTLMSYVE